MASPLKNRSGGPEAANLYTFVTLTGFRWNWFRRECGDCRVDGSSMTAKEVQKNLRRLGDAAVAASSARFFKKEHVDKDVFVGLRAATLRQLAKEYRELPLAELETLLHSDIHEERSLALLILGLVIHRATDFIRKQVYDFYLANTEHVNNWDLVDVSA